MDVFRKARTPPLSLTNGSNKRYGYFPWLFPAVSYDEIGCYYPIIRQVRLEFFARPFSRGSTLIGPCRHISIGLKLTCGFASNICHSSKCHLQGLRILSSTVMFQQCGGFFWIGYKSKSRVFDRQSKLNNILFHRIHRHGKTPLVKRKRSESRWQI